MNNDPAEAAREREVRRVQCPICACAAPPTQPCTYPNPRGFCGRWAHTGRYNAAAAQGLVPALTGGGQAATQVRRTHTRTTP